MKFSSMVCAAVVVFCSFAAAASEGTSVLLLSNGDVEVDKVGSAFAAERTVVELNTNAECRVLCQVYYRDNLNPLPTDLEEIKETDRIVNLLLGTYFCSECWGLSEEELVEEYRTGTVCDRLLRFPEWAEKMILALNDTEELDKLDLSVVAVSMTAVGEFGQRVAE